MYGTGLHINSKAEDKDIEQIIKAKNEEYIKHAVVKA
jgi:hypothetical protein